MKSIIKRAIEHIKAAGKALAEIRSLGMGPKS